VRVLGPLSNRQSTLGIRRLFSHHDSEPLRLQLLVAMAAGAAPRHGRQTGGLVTPGAIDTTWGAIGAAAVVHLPAGIQSVSRGSNDSDGRRIRLLM
jgi:hypothetical protein